MPYPGVNTKTIDDVKQLLLYTELTPEEIASRVEWSFSGLSRRFKANTGVTMRQWRKAKRELE